MRHGNYFLLQKSAHIVRLTYLLAEVFGLGNLPTRTGHKAIKNFRWVY